MTAQAFIDAIVEDPDDLARWVVYADWLLEHDDPRGELINLELDQEVGATGLERMFRMNALRRDEAMLSPRLRACADRWDLELRRSFIRAARLLDHRADNTPGSAAEMLDALFADPHAALLERLSCHSPDPAADALFAAPRLHLRELEIEELGPFGHRLAEVMPRLERLHVSDPDLVHLAHPTLRRLSSGEGTCPAACLGAVDAPKLEVLAWELVGSRELLVEPRSLLRGQPGLAFELYIEDTTVLDLDALADLPSSAGVVKLDLVGQAAAIERLVPLAHRFSKLRELCVRIRLPGLGLDGALEAMLEGSRALRDQLRRAYPAARIEFPMLDDLDVPPPAPHPIDAIGRYHRGGRDDV